MGHSALTTTGIAIVVVGATFGLILVAAVAWMCVRKRQRPTAARGAQLERETSPTMNGNRNEGRNNNRNDNSNDNRNDTGLWLWIQAG